MGVADVNGYKEGRPTPFKVHSLGELQGKAIPERDWLIGSVLVKRSITLFAGDGGVGKSLMTMQLQVAAALGKDWLGLQIPRPISSLGFYCEDDKDELDRRFEKICQHYGCQFSDIGDLVRYCSRVGEMNNELVSFRGKGDLVKAQRTDMYGQIEDEVKAWGTELIILDTASDIFAGNENIRYQVKTFVTILRGLAIINNGGIILNSHPSKSGMQDGSGFSGSTAWNGAVRNRMYLATPKHNGEEEDDGPTNKRVLKVMKSNYGPFGEKIYCEWKNHVFVRESSAPGSMLDRLKDDARILKAIEYIISNGGRVAANPQARNSAASAVPKLPSCRDLSFRAVVSSQDRLVTAGKLLRVELGPPSKRAVFLRPQHVVYPGEKST